MNRAQRRGTKKSPQYKSIPLPKAIEEFKIFETPEAILNAISSEEMTAINNEPHIMCGDALLRPAAAVLAGWLYTWFHIREESSVDFKIEPLITIEERLRKDVLITRVELAHAQECLLDIRKAFRIIPIELINRVGVRCRKEINEKIQCN